MALFNQVKASPRKFLARTVAVAIAGLLSLPSALGSTVGMVGTTMGVIALSTSVIAATSPAQARRRTQNGRKAVRAHDFHIFKTVPGAGPSKTGGSKTGPSKTGGSGLRR